MHHLYKTPLFPSSPHKKNSKQNHNMERRGRKKKVWLSLQKSLHCKTEASDVHDPDTKNQLAAIQTKKSGSRSGCSRSISNLKDVIHGSKRHIERPTSCSPRSIGSSEFLNPIVHEVILSDSACELRITGTPGSRGNSKASSFRKSPNFAQENKGSLKFRVDGSNGSSSSVACHKCAEQFCKLESLEAHHLSKHAVTELMEGDSARKIVEIICRATLTKTENQSVRIERVLKVQNMQKTIARFEEYREMVKNKASKLPKKHPRCIADGNELLRFHGTTISCSLGLHDSTSLCVSTKCSVCRIIGHGFSNEKGNEGGIGVFTSSTSARAFDSIVMSEDDSSMRKALIVCRVIAGRVHRPLENMQEMVGQIGFDSLAGKIGLYSNIEELYLLNPRALLPCFVVICKS